MADPGASERRVIIFDIDGTLAKVEHRLHHIETRPRDWGAFFAASYKDEPHDEILYLNHLLAKDPNNLILVVTGRSEHQRGTSIEWLERHEIYFHDIFLRPKGDRREDSEVKAEILERIIADYGRPYLVFEDRSRVVEMWRQKGIKCLQVEPGDF